MGEGLPQSTGCNHHPCLPGGAPMSVSHISAVLQTPSLWQLAQCIRHHQDQWQQSEEPLDLERFERELHDHVMAGEPALLADWVSRFYVPANSGSVDGVPYRRRPEAPQPRVSAAGPHTG